MTNTNYYTRRNYTDHSRFGGTITNGDFCTEYSQKKGEHVKRIISDWNFDRQCGRNILNRERNNTHKKGIE